MRDALVLVSPLLHGVGPLGELKANVLLGVEVFSGCMAGNVNDILGDFVGRSERSPVGRSNNEGSRLASGQGGGSLVDCGRHLDRDGVVRVIDY
mgnify:CR=1 FL=1